MRWMPVFAMLVVLVTNLDLFAQENVTDDLNQRAHQILQTRCYRCHGGSAKQAGLDVLSRPNLLENRGLSGASIAWVAPGSIDDSMLLDTIQPGPTSYMPQQGSPEAKAMTDEEKAVLSQWVEAGAEFPTIDTRPFISEIQILKAMRNYLLSVNADDRRNIRFYTLTHLHNNPTVSELDMRLYRAAFSKTLNSLTKRREIFIPEPLPETGETVYPINLELLQWNRDHIWAEILSHYPYALNYDYSRDQELQQLWKDVVDFSRADVPYVRADWFIVTATRPPLYHLLLDIPETLMELEEQLQFNIMRNFLRGDVARSGYAKSGVSQQNRLLERHTTPVTSFFWISYDFLPRQPRGDLTRFPLGPASPQNPYRQQAFEHDGGEIIWSLPNGMQAYMLIDAAGKRIDEGPIEVVFDRSAVLGNPKIVNGISCIYCHRQGMITEFRDEIRQADAVGGDVREHVLKIYPPHEKMQALTKEDQESFLRALEKVTGPFLQIGQDKDKKITDFAEPVGKVVDMYARDLTPQELASELGMEKLEDLQAKIQANRELLRYGLGTMIQNPPGTLKRDKWKTREGTSLMQDVASELRIGTPLLMPRPQRQ